MQQLYQRRLDKKNNITYIKYKVKRYITPHLVNFGTIIIRGNFVSNIILVSTSTSICTFSGCHFFFCNVQSGMSVYSYFLLSNYFAGYIWLKVQTN